MINGVIAQDAHIEPEIKEPLAPLTMVPREDRKLIEVLARMDAVIPSTGGKKDKLSQMLLGIGSAYMLYSCRETAHLGWQSVVGALLQRLQGFGEDTQIPEWFGTVCSIFRGDR